MSLKIKPVADPPELTRLSVKIPIPTANLLNTYMDVFQETYGKSVNCGFIVNEILLSFFDSDKKFQEFLKKRHRFESTEPPENIQSGGKDGENR